MDVGAGETWSCQRSIDQIPCTQQHLAWDGTIGKTWMQKSPDLPRHYCGHPERCPSSRGNRIGSAQISLEITVGTQRDDHAHAATE